MAFFLKRTGLKDGRGKYLMPTLPFAATGLVASNITQSSFQLDWNVAEGATSYRVETSLTGADTWTDKGTTTDLLLSVTGLATDTGYDVRVISINSAGEKISGIILVTTAAIILPAQPNAPNDVSYASTISSTEIVLSWGSTADTDSYTVEYKLTSSGTWLQAVTGITITNHTVTGLDSASSYDFRIVAVNTEGSTNGIPATYFTIPYIPNNFAITATGVTTVDFSWDAVTNAESYTIEELDGAWSAVASGLTGTTHQLTGLTGNTAYDFRIKAKHSSATGNFGESDASPTQSTTTLQAAPAVNETMYQDLTNQNDDRYLMRWTEVDTGHEYQVDRRVLGAGTWDIGMQGNIAELQQFIHNTSPQGSNPAPITVLANTIYEHRLRAKFTNSDWGAWSSIVTAQTYPSIPAAPTLNTRTINSITVNLDQSNTDTVTVGYRVAGTGDPLTEFTGITATTYEITGLTQEQDYEIYQQTVNERGSLGYSAALNASTRPFTPNAPINLASSNIAKTQLDLTWDNGGGVVDTYDVEYKLTSEPTVWTSFSSVSDTFDTVTGLTQETSYDFRVRANNVTGTSGWSPIHTVSTIGLITLRPISDSATDASWTTTPYWSKVDDVNDTTFIIGDGGNGTIRLNFGNPGVTITGATCYVRHRQGAGNNTGTISVDVVEANNTVTYGSTSFDTNANASFADTAIPMSQVTAGEFIHITLSRFGGGNPSQRQSVEIAEIWIEY